MSVIKCIPNFWQRRNAEIVDLQHCSMVYVPDQVIACGKTLQELYLDANQLTELPKSFFKLTQLRKLGLGDNELTVLSPDVGHLEHLTELDLSRNSIDELPDEIRKCRNLHVLDMTGNPLKGLPLGFMQLTNLTNLTLNDVTLCDLPNNIGELVSLTHLEARDNYFAVVPQTIGRLSHLRLLDLGGNELSFLPDTIGNLTSLEECSLDANQLSQLPITIGRLKNLVALDVTDNRLYRLPDSIGGCSALIDLIVTQNMIETLPDTIGQLKNLRLLKADQNRLVALTAAIGECLKLRDLILSHNLLYQLPPTIGRLRYLQMLNADNNQLEFIPPELGNCENLRILSIQNNLVESLPQTLGKVEQLKILYLAGNKLEHLPGSLKRCKLQAVWLTEAQSKPLMAFCEDVDYQTGQTVLRCCLLPQQQIAGGSLENLTRSSMSTEEGSLRRQRDAMRHFDQPIVTSTPAPSAGPAGAFNLIPSYGLSESNNIQPVPKTVTREDNLNNTITIADDHQQQQQQQPPCHRQSSTAGSRSQSLTEASGGDALNSTYTVTGDSQSQPVVQSRSRSMTDQSGQLSGLLVQANSSFASSEPSRNQARVDSPVVIQSPTSLSLNDASQPTGDVLIEKKVRHQEFDETGTCTLQETDTRRITYHKPTYHKPSQQEYYNPNEQVQLQQQPPPPFPTRASVVRVQVTRGRPTTSASTGTLSTVTTTSGDSAPAVAASFPPASDIATTSSTSSSGNIHCPGLPLEALDDELTNLAASYELRVAEAPKAKLDSDTDFSGESDARWKKKSPSPKPAVLPKPKINLESFIASSSAVSPPVPETSQNQSLTSPSRSSDVSRGPKPWKSDFKVEQLSSPPGLRAEESVQSARSQDSLESGSAPPTFEKPSDRLKRLREARDDFFKRAFENEPVYTPVIHTFELPPELCTSTVASSAPSSVTTTTTTVATNATTTTTITSSASTAQPSVSAVAAQGAFNEKPTSPEEHSASVSEEGRTVYFKPPPPEKARQSGRVSFATAQDGDEDEGEASEEEEGSGSQLKRQKTPLPRDLKTKSGFLSRFHGPKRGSIDGSVIPHNPELANRDSFAFRPQRNSPAPQDENAPEDAAADTERASSRSPPPKPPPPSVPILSSQETSSCAKEESPKSTSEVTTSEIEVKSTRVVTTKSTTTSYITTTGEPEEQTDSSERRHNKSVNFEEDRIVDKEPDSDWRPLQRHDTPHHLLKAKLQLSGSENEGEKQKLVLQLLSAEKRQQQSNARLGSVEIPVEIVNSEATKEVQVQPVPVLSSDSNMTSTTTTASFSGAPNYLPSGFRGNGIALANEQAQQQLLEDAEYIERLRQKQQSMMAALPRQPNAPIKPVKHEAEVDSSDGEASVGDTSSAASTSTSDHQDSRHVYNGHSGLITVVPNNEVVGQQPASRHPVKVQVVRGVNVRAPSTSNSNLSQSHLGTMPDSPPRPTNLNKSLSPGSHSQQSEPVHLERQVHRRPPTAPSATSETSLSSTAVEYGVVRREYRLSKAASGGQNHETHPSNTNAINQRLPSPSATLTPTLTTPPTTPQPATQVININRDVTVETAPINDHQVFEREQAALADRLRELQASPRLVRSSSLREILMAEKPTTTVPGISSFQTDAQPVYASIGQSSVEIVFNKPTTLVCSTAPTEATRLKRLSHGSSEGSPRPPSKQSHPTAGGSGDVAFAGEAPIGDTESPPQPCFRSSSAGETVHGRPGSGRPVVHVDGQAYETVVGPDGRLFVVPQGSSSQPTSLPVADPQSDQPLFVETNVPPNEGPVSEFDQQQQQQQNQYTPDGRPVSMEYDPNCQPQYQQQQPIQMGPEMMPPGMPMPVPMGPPPPMMGPPPGVVPMGPPINSMPMGPPPGVALAPQPGPALHPPINPPPKKVLLELDRVELRLTVRKDPALGFGMRVAGGRGSTPFKGDDEGIFVSSITKDGPASRAGLSVGDKLLSVSGYNLIGADHQQAVTTLKKAGKMLELVVEREVFANGPDSSITTKHFPEVPGVQSTPGEEYEVQGETLSSCLRRDVQYGGIGISLGGGRGTSIPLTSKFTADAIYVSKIHPGGPADREGILKIGDRILTVNGIDVTDSRHDQVVALLDASPEIRLIVYREHIVQKPKATDNSCISSTSNTMRSESKPSSQNAVVPYQRNSPPTAQQQWPISTVGTCVPANLPPVNVFPTPGMFLVPMQPATGAVFIPSHAAVPPNALPGQNGAIPNGMPPNGMPGAPPNFMGGSGMPGSAAPPNGSIGGSIVPGGGSMPRPSGGSHHHPNGTIPGSMSHSHYGGMFPSNGCPVDPATGQFVYPGGGGGNSGSGYPDSFQQYPTSNGGLGYRPSTPPAGAECGGRPSGSVPPSPGPLVQKSRSEASLLCKPLPEPYSTEEVRVIKAGGPLGISIVGGTDHACQPFGTKDAPGVFISKITPDGPASQTSLRIGDRLLEVNGVDVRQATHQEAVAALITPVHEVRLFVRHDPQPAGLQEIVLFRGAGEKLGLSIRGGVNSPSGNPYDKMDDGIFVSKITAGCIAHDGRIQVGHRLIEVNGVSLLGAAHQEAVNLLRNVDGQFTMMVCNGWNQRIAQNVMLGKAKSIAGGSQADSLCTVDRMDVEFFTKQGYTVEWTKSGTAVVKQRPDTASQHHQQNNNNNNNNNQQADEISQNGSQENSTITGACEPPTYIYQNLPPVPGQQNMPPQQQQSKKSKKSARS